MKEQLSPFCLEYNKAAERLAGVVVNTPLQLSVKLSRRYLCKIYLKREDLQVVRSYKIRGAYNMISSLSGEQRAGSVVWASAGNHAQGLLTPAKSLVLKA